MRPAVIRMTFNGTLAICIFDILHAEDFIIVKIHAVLLIKHFFYL